MRKRMLSSLLLGCALLTGGVSTAYTVHAEDSQTQTGTATIILVNNCDWEDSSGFQFLLDADHDTYGDVIPDSGPLSIYTDAPSSVYDRFEYKIPGNADGARDTQNNIPYGSSAKITIPAGTYDYVITNPTPGDNVWIVGSSGTDEARMDDYVFEAGKVYTYTVSKVGTRDGVFLSIHEHSYSNSIWNSDESGHWQECDDTNCPDKASSVTKTAHISNDDADCTTTDTCNVCGYTIAAGRSEHAFGEWQHDDAAAGMHIRKCETNGCNASETAKCSGGTATCTEKAKCEVCGESYGDLNPSNHTGTEEWIQTADTHEKKWNCCNLVSVAKEKHEWKDGVCQKCGYNCEHSGGTATCHEKAVCTSCGAEYGEYDSDNHAGETEVRKKQSATCTKDGYTGDTYCKGCGKKLSSGSVVKAKGHKGGTATCSEKAKCEVCGESYGELNPNNHTGAEVRKKQSATCTKDGYTGDTYCKGCGKKLSSGSVVKAKGHKGGTATCSEKAKCEVCGETYGEIDSENHSDFKHVDAKAATKKSEGNVEYWYCDGCGKYYSDEAGKKEIKAEAVIIPKLKDESKSLQTGDNSAPVLAVVLLFVSGGAAIGVMSINKKRKK